jgi:hypothetical protein
MEPTLIQRECGGWLALSPRSEDLRVGVLAPTEAGAREAFEVELGEWRRLLESATVNGNGQP